MTGTETLQRLEGGYRMPKPAGERFPCPDGLYDIMLKCWDKVPENRPTFSFLRDFFDDFFVAEEGQYRGPDEY